MGTPPWFGMSTDIEPEAGLLVDGAVLSLGPGADRPPPGRPG